MFPFDKVIIEMHSFEWKRINFDEDSTELWSHESN